jgi:hypothetical protein
VYIDLRGSLLGAIQFSSHDNQALLRLLEHRQEGPALLAGSAWRLDELTV